MKRVLLMTLSCVVCLFVVACNEKVQPDNGDVEDPNNTVTPADTTGSVTPSLDYSSLTADNHPRVIFTDDDFASMAALYKAGTNTYFNQIHDLIISDADATVGSADLERVLTGKRLLTVCQTAVERILCCAYAYKTTGETKYLTQAEHDIQTVCNFSDWNAPAHFLDGGEMATAVGLGFDWLYNDLSASTKSLAETSVFNFVFNYALYKYTSVTNNFYAATNNWNSVCNGGMVCAALAMYEDLETDASQIISKALSTNVACVTDGYSPDGNYPEGYMYWNYGTMYEALMLTALQTALGSDNGLSDISGFSTTGKYQIYMEGPSGYCFNYSDCSKGTKACLPQWYFAWRFGDLSVLYLEKDKIKSMYASANEVRLLPVVAWYASKIVVSGVSAPTDQLYSGEGLTPVVLIHDTWTMDGNDKFLGIKGGKGNTAHGHLDAGSFVYDAEGVRWAYDFGQQSYSTLEPYINLWSMVDGSERWTAFRYNNFNHNTITVNDAYHKAAGVGTFTEIINSDGRKGAVIDITEAVGPSEVSSVVRTIYMEGDDLVIEDEIIALSSKAANVRWTMATLAEPVNEGYGFMTLKQSGVTRYLTYSSSTSHKITWQIWSTEGSHSWDASNSGTYECGYTLTVAAGTKAVVTMRLTKNDPLG